MIILGDFNSHIAKEDGFEDVEENILHMRTQLIMVKGFCNYVVRNIGACMIHEILEWMD